MQRLLMKDKTSDQELKQQKMDYLVTFNSKEGERVLADLTSAYYHRSSFSKTPMKLLLRKGKEQ